MDTSLQFFATTSRPLFEADQQPTKRCAGCKDEKPLSVFGRNAANDNRGARDGKNISCKVCVNVKVAEGRQRIREYKAVQSKAKLPRRKRQIDANFSPRQIARMLRKLSPADRVREAIRCGARTQKEILQVVKLPKDEVTDCIADLLLWQHSITTKVISGTRMYFVKKQPPVTPSRKPMAMSFASVSAIMPGRKQKTA